MKRWLPLFLLSAAGCEFTAPGGPVVIPTSVVEGTILYNGRPLPHGGVGWVTFFPERATVGDATCCRLKADGSYRCDRTPVGTVNVRIDLAPTVLAQLPMEVRSWVGVLRGPTTPLRMKTSADAPARFDFDLRPPLR